MLISEVSAYINSLVDSNPDLRFMRATDLQANVSADFVDLSEKILTLYNNLPEVSHNVSRAGHATADWPVNIKFLRLANLDDKENESDLIRSFCQDAAYKLINIVDQELFAEYPIQYNIEFLNQTKVYDKTLTGCVLTFTLRVDVIPYPCSPGASGRFNSTLQQLIAYAQQQGYTIPSFKTLYALNSLIGSWLSSGVWGNLDELYIFQTDGDSDWSRINLVNPNIPATISPGVTPPIFYPGEGWGPGASGVGRITSGFPINHPSITKFGRNNGSIFTHYSGNTNDSGFGFYGLAPANTNLYAEVYESRTKYSVTSPATFDVSTFNIRNNFNLIERYTLENPALPGTLPPLLSKIKLFSNGLQLSEEDTPIGGALPNLTPSVLAIQVNVVPGTFAKFANQETRVKIFGFGNMNALEASVYIPWATYLNSI